MSPTRALSAAAVGTSLLIAGAIASATPSSSPRPAATAAPAAAPPRAASLREAYGLFRRPDATGDRVAHGSAGTARRAQNRPDVDVHLVDEGDRLCVVATPNRAAAGGMACGVASAAATEPPILVLQDGEDALVVGAAPDGVASVDIENAAGALVPATPAGNAFVERVAGGVRGVSLRWGNGAVSRF